MAAPLTNDLPTTLPTTAAALSSLIAGSPVAALAISRVLAARGYGTSPKSNEVVVASRHRSDCRSASGLLQRLAAGQRREIAPVSSSTKYDVDGVAEEGAELEGGGEVVSAYELQRLQNMQVSSVLSPPSRFLVHAVRLHARRTSHRVLA